MKIIALFLIISIPRAALAQTPLAFSARIQSEELAEEAIDLLHCLADRLEIPWELNEESKAPYRLKVQEKDGKLNGNFISPEEEVRFELSKGESNKICADLIPEEEAAAPISLPDKSWEPESKKPTWMWIGAAAAVIAGGFLLWKSQADHRSFKME